MRKILFILTVFVLAGFAGLSGAQAQDGEMTDTSKSCTMPRDNDPVADTDKRWKYCDIHARTFAYRDKHIEMKKMLAARAENYKASTKWARDQHKAELERYHAGLGSANTASGNE